MSSAAKFDVAIVGGGAYGCILAIQLHRRGFQRILLLERERRLLQRASYTNQARVHNGYHYPRSFLTAHRSRINFDRFVAEFRECIDASFEKYYAIARYQSNVTARQFELFCERIGAPVEPANDEIHELFDLDRIERVFRVQECAFDAIKLRRRLARDLETCAITLCPDTEVLRVTPTTGTELELHARIGGSATSFRADTVLNCTYSRTNKLLTDSGLRRIPLKHELTELALVEVPERLRHVGITVMCGPFFSLMPFPPKGCHSLSHVRYTPHGEWHDDPDRAYRDPYELLATATKQSRFAHMRQDAQRYLPMLRDCRPTESLWEVKTVLPMSEIDDSRPILLRRSADMPTLINVMGSKIDNVYDVMEPLESMLSSPALP